MAQVVKYALKFAELMAGEELPAVLAPAWVLAAVRVKPDKLSKFCAETLTLGFIAGANVNLPRSAL